MSDSILIDKLTTLYEATDSIVLPRSHRIVVFSDLHMGNGGSNDQFTRNSELFTAILRDFYLPDGYTLILNGDVEELQRFALKAIQRTWSKLYEVFDAFYENGRMYKTVGNHDYELYTLPHLTYQYEIRPAVKYDYRGDHIFILHGHQASNYFERWHTLHSIVLRYAANPLKITHRTVAHDSRRKYRIERRVYDFATSQKVITLIGHTHRPLFESHSKIDELRFKIELSLRRYTGSSKRKQRRIQEEIQQYRDELSQLHEKHEEESLQSSLYNELLVPSVFNSGCTVGRRGLTGIEIVDGEIRLVYWFDKRKNPRRLHGDQGDDLVRLGDSPYYRKTLNADTLDYIFARIKLLS